MKDSSAADSSVNDFLPAMKIVSYSISILILLLGITIVVQIWRGKINVEKLISEADGTASMSRFQFLVFTFVISGSYFMHVLYLMDNITNIADFALPDVSNGSLILLGISGGGYVTSKIIQTDKEKETAKVESGKTDKDGKPKYSVDY